ncbi:antitoxin VapB40 [Mycobacterium tuberculosis variant bovis BCG]|nr:antitoxin VapB40 [Mycobacterium tuberculosis variant bovis BCG]
MIPKRIRERLGLRGNDQVEITERDGRIEIEPARPVSNSFGKARFSSHGQNVPCPR